MNKFLNKTVDIIHNGLGDYITGVVTKIEEDSIEGGKGRILLDVIDLNKNKPDDYVQAKTEIWFYNIFDKDFEIREHESKE